MPTVRDVLARKATHEVLSLPPSASALEAAQLMNDHAVGAVVVMAEGTLLGIFTERDVLRRVVAAQRHPREVPLSEVMTKAPVTCSPATPVEECAAVMTARRIRHLPVLDAVEGLVGLVSIGDIVALQVSEQAGLIEELNRYIHDVR